MQTQIRLFLGEQSDQGLNLNQGWHLVMIEEFLSALFKRMTLLPFFRIFVDRCKLLRLKRSLDHGYFH